MDGWMKQTWRLLIVECKDLVLLNTVIYVFYMFFFLGGWGGAAPHGWPRVLVSWPGLWTCAIGSKARSPTCWTARALLSAHDRTGMTCFGAEKLETGEKRVREKEESCLSNCDHQKCLHTLLDTVSREGEESGTVWSAPTHLPMKAEFSLGGVPVSEPLFLNLSPSFDSSASQSLTDLFWISLPKAEANLCSVTLEGRCEGHSNSKTAWETQLESLFGVSHLNVWISWMDRAFKFNFFSHRRIY